MKKRWIVTILVACLLLACLAPGAVASPTVYFTAINDFLLPLSTSTMPVYTGGAIYVPYTVFCNSDLQVYYSYNAGTQVAGMLYGSTQIYFDLAQGLTYDIYGNQYASVAIFRNSTVYVPAQFLCRLFGFSYAYIGTDIAPIIRIKNGNCILTDAAFREAAASSMQDRYDQYIRDITPATPEPTPSQNVDPSPSPSVTYPNVPVYLLFASLPAEPDSVLDALDTYACKAAFFLTADEIAENGDLVRQLLGQGHSIGLLCNGDSLDTDYAKGSLMLRTVAKQTSLLVMGAGIDEQAAADLGLVLCHSGELLGSDLYSQARNIIADASSSSPAILPISGAALEEDQLDSLLRYLYAGNYSVTNITETVFS